MRTGAAAGHRGFVHEALIYASDEEFLSVVVPFLEGGLAAGEPTVVATGEQTAELVRAAMPDTPELSFAPGRDRYTRPATVIESYRQMLATHVASGAQQIRVLGEVPLPSAGALWDWWARYEATINHAWDNFPIWGLCPYDTRTTPEHVLNDVARTHPYLATADGRHTSNDRYTDPVEFLTEPRPSSPDPLESSPPLSELVNPTPAAARRAVLDASRGTRLSPTDVEDLVLAVNETVTNAINHGLPPVQLRLWSVPDRVVVTVTDQGSGPTDPFAGLVPGAKAPAGGLGLWMTHQLCNLVTVDQDEQSCTVRLVAGEPTSTA